MCGVVEIGQKVIGQKVLSSMVRVISVRHAKLLERSVYEYIVKYLKCSEGALKSLRPSLKMVKL
jgi:hypothetical protein